MSLWGYRDAHGRIVATSPENMEGNTGWEEVPDGTKPQQETEPQEGAQLSTEQQLDSLRTQNADIMDGLIEVADIVVGGA